MSGKFHILASLSLGKEEALVPTVTKLNRTECVRIKSIINVPKGMWRRKVHILFRQTQHVETDQF
jgi:hypothetical protein